MTGVGSGREAIEIAANDDGRSLAVSVRNVAAGAEWEKAAVAEFDAVFANLEQHIKP